MMSSVAFNGHILIDRIFIIFIPKGTDERQQIIRS